jgi:capsular polysaccharide transport system permease protein
MKKEGKAPADPAAAAAKPAGAGMSDQTDTRADNRLGQLVHFGQRSLRPEGERPLAPAPGGAVPAPAPPPRPTLRAPTPVRKPKTKRKARRRFGSILSFVLLAVLPAAVAYVYFGFYAANQYISEAKFAIRAQIPAGAGKNPLEGGGNLLLGFANYGIPSIADTFIVTDYIQSAQVLRDIGGSVDLRKIYSYEGADWLYRLDPNVSDEALLAYWRKVSSVYYDISTGVTTFTVRAFTPEDAQKIGVAVLAASQKLVSDMSKQAQDDTLDDARNQVDLTKKRLDEALDKIEQFQQQKKQIDPTALAKGRSEIEAKLEGEIAGLEAQYSSLRAALAEDAPTVRLLRNQIESTRKQLATERAKSASGGEAVGDTAAVSSLLVGFDRLGVEREFAAKAYASALSGFELARQEASRQSRYLVSFVPPQLPDDTLYPNRPYFIAIAAIGGLLVWLLFRLIGSVIREHI